MSDEDLPLYSVHKPGILLGSSFSAECFPDHVGKICFGCGLWG